MKKIQNKNKIEKVSLKNYPIYILNTPVLIFAKICLIHLHYICGDYVSFRDKIIVSRRNHYSKVIQNLLLIEMIHILNVS